MRPWLSIAAIAIVYAQPGVPLGTPAAVARGDKLFAQGCAVGYCHGAAGTAARSPRLRGRTFDRDYLIRVIREGIPNTAMPAWGDRLTDRDIGDLADYVQSLANAPVGTDEAPTAAVTQTAPAPVTVTELPEEQRRGRELFFDLTRQGRCSICHQLEGVGVAVGPEIAKVSSLKEPDALKVLRYGRPRTVRTIVLKSGERFPGVIAERSAARTRVYDLSATPPVLRTILQAELAGIQRQTNWLHRTAVRAYTNEELQLLWNFIRFTLEPK